MMRGFVVGFVLLFVASVGVNAQTSDRDHCGSVDAGTAESRIAACTRVISSGRLKATNLADIYHYRAYMYENSLKDYERAVADYRQALRLDPNSTRGDLLLNAHFKRGTQYLAQQQWDRAIADFNEAIKLPLRSAAALANRGAAYLGKREFHRAIADLNEADRRAPSDATITTLRGDFFRETGEHKKALELYESVLRSDSGNKPALEGREKSRAALVPPEPVFANDFEACKELTGEKSLQVCTRAIESGAYQGKELATLFHMRSVGYGTDDRARAMADLDRAIALNPTDAGLFRSRAELLVDNDPARALIDYNEAIRLNSSESFYFYRRGMVHARLKDFERAIADQNEALRIAGKDDLNVVDMVFERGTYYAALKDHDRAISDFDEAMRLLPDFELFFLHRGRSFAAKGEYDRAIADYDEALKIKPDYAEVSAAREAAVAVRASVKPDGAAPPSAETKAPAAKPEVVAVAPPVAPVQPAPTKPVIAAVTPPAALVQPAPKIDRPPPGKRVALVMGNADYRNVAKLDNTITDARTMRDTLTRLGFEVVYGENLDRRAMGRHIGEFGSIVRDADAAVVYFAGHGSTFADIPYVVPIDSKYESLSNIPAELIQVESLVSELRRAKGVRLVILDACRDNEREIELKRQDAALKGLGTRGGTVGRGLAKLQNPDGLIVVYSTQHMTTAADGKPGGNSPFTGALARHLVTPGVDIKDVLFRTASEVIRESGGTQRPEIAISLFDPFVLAQ